MACNPKVMAETTHAIAVVVTAAIAAAVAAATNPINRQQYGISCDRGTVQTRYCNFPT
ncbi:hypothetical protein K440DRAFT_619759 [Wilcoxina mikolae CBS 423.85]|nr:hypothetical protein K440DRAFT_619759 [Wilcoxina mikolae CBS 423.85]